MPKKIIVAFVGTWSLADQAPEIGDDSRPVLIESLTRPGGGELSDCAIASVLS